MTDALLPQGFRDRLYPHADADARVEAALLAVAHGHGYERVEPPLAEFEDGLAHRLAGGGTRAAVRFVDPVSQRSLAIRPDITAQVGRIATTRLAANPRPLRLSYAGPVLRLQAPPLDPARARRQVGIELIGRDSVAAAREVVAVAVAALAAAGVTGISVDFTLPDLIATLAAGPLPVPAERIAELRDALDAKDAGRVAALAPAYLPLVAAAGPFAESLDRLRAFDTGGVLAARLDGLAAIAKGLDARLTLDPTERHGFEYQSWFGFSLFATGVASEIGRGGTYAIRRDAAADEPATGVSLYPDLIAGLAPAGRRRVFLPLGHDAAHAAALRAAGWAAVAALDPEDTAAAQACSHVLADDGSAQPV